MKEVPMGALSKIFKPRDKPENRTSGRAFDGDGYGLHAENAGPHQGL